MSRRLCILLALAVLLVPGTTVAAEEAAASPRPTAVASPVPQPSADASFAPGEPVAAVQPLPEPDFVVGDWELQVIPWEQLRFNGGSVQPLRTVGLQDARGVPMRALGAGGRLVYNPTVIAQQGMKRLDSYVRTGKREHLRHARKFADVLDQLATGSRQRRWQPHRYDRGVHQAGWVNANSHGLVLSFLSRYHELTGAPERLRSARLMMAAFEQRRENQRWISLVTDAGYIWFEHWPDGRHDHTLNAHLNALLGIYDYWRVTGSPLAEQYVLGGAKTVREKLYRFRRKGALSRYSLSPTVGSLHYHQTHIDQLRTLALITGDDWFDRQADRLERDERIWRARNRGGSG